MTIHFESTPIKIGKHEWRIIVYSGHPGYEKWRRFTRYQWRPLPIAGLTPDPWRNDEKWPHYNSDDGTYAGCPKSLADKVFMPNQTAIKNAIEAGGHNEFPLDRK